MNIECINQYTPIEITTYVTKEYYKDNKEPFFAILHPDAVFLSVGSGHLVEGLKNIKQAYEIGKRQEGGDKVEYEILSLRSTNQRVSPTMYNVFMQMEIATYYSNGRSEKVNQRISVNWKKCKELEVAPGDIRTGWFAMSLHISVGIDPMTADINIAHMAPSVKGKTGAGKIIEEEEKYPISDCSRCVFFVRKQEIVRIFSKDAKRHVCLADGKEIVTRKSMQDFEKELEHAGFLRIHHSQMVNCAYVVGMKNRNVILTDGQKLVVPKDKSSTVRKELREKTENIPK